MSVINFQLLNSEFEELIKQYNYNKSGRENILSKLFEKIIATQQVNQSVNVKPAISCFIWNHSADYEMPIETYKTFIKQQYAIKLPAIRLLSAVGEGSKLEENAFLKLVSEQLENAIEKVNYNLCSAVVELLKESNISKDYKDKFLYNSVIFLCDKIINCDDEHFDAYVKILDELRKVDCPINAFDVKTKRTALHKAAQSGDFRFAKVLLERNADPNILDAFQKTPFLYACLNGRNSYLNQEVIDLFHKHGAYLKLDHIDWGRIENHQMSCVLNLLKDKEKFLPHKILTKFNIAIDINEELIEEFDIDEREELKKALVHERIETYSALVNALLQLDVSLDIFNSTDSFGKAPLHYLCDAPVINVPQEYRDRFQNRVNEWTQQLIEKGVDTAVGTSKGKVAYDFLLENEKSFFELVIQSNPSLYNPYQEAPEKFTELTRDMDLALRATRLSHASFEQLIAFFEQTIEVSDPILLHWDIFKSVISNKEQKQNIEKNVRSALLIARSSLNAIEKSYNRYEKDLRKSAKEQIELCRAKLNIIESELLSLNSQEFSLSNHPVDFICPITKQLMVQPVKDKHGHFYEKEALTKWVDQYGRSGLGLPLSLDEFVEDAEKAKEIKAYKAQALIKRVIEKRTRLRANRLHLLKERTGTVSRKRDIVQLLIRNRHASLQQKKRARSEDEIDLQNKRVKTSID